MESRSYLLLARLGRLVLYAVLIILALITLFPFIWMFVTALKTSREVFQWPIVLIPQVPQWGNFAEAWTRQPFTRFFQNTVFITLGTTALTLFTSSTAGFAFAKYEFRGKRILFILVLMMLMLPPQVTLIPTFLMARSLGLVNNYFGLLIPGITSVFGIFLIRQYLQSIPDELIDAARIDGCNDWNIYTMIILPLITPALAVLTIFTFTSSWNSFLWPLIIATSSDMYTLQVGIAFFSGQTGTEYQLMMAVAVVSMLPVVLIYVLFQRYFVASDALAGLNR
ncbi:MAG: carbohydrate ABC transporter permease [Anaerolineae bacterium]|nr:carbohydrate ABC transporter permease [Anaerolineae bacterium]